MLFQFMQNLPVNEFTDLTRAVEQKIEEAKVTEGICIVTLQCTGAGLVFAEKGNQAVMHDIKNELDRLLPPRVNYESGPQPCECSGRTKAALLCASKDIAIVNGKPVMGDNRGLYALNFSQMQDVCVTIECI